MSLMHPRKRSNDERRHDQAAPIARHDAKESLPEVAANGVPRCRTSNKEPAQTEEPVQRGDGNCGAVPKYPFTPEAPEGDGVRENHGKTERQSEEVQTVVPWGEGISYGESTRRTARGFRICDGVASQLGSSGQFSWAH
jgi:hypothetical protein